MKDESGYECQSRTMKRKPVKARLNTGIRARHMTTLKAQCCNNRADQEFLNL